MRRFELRKIAKRIAQLEKIIVNSSTTEEQEKVEKEIFQLIIQNNLNLVDMIEIDEMVQNMLQ